METKGIMGGFMRISEWIMRFFASHILWAIMSFPVIFFVLPVLMFEEADLVFTMLAVGILAPFTLFPATSALFSLVRKWIIGDADVPIIKTYFVSYKKSYLQSMVVGILYSVLFFVEFIGYRFYLHQDNFTQVLSSLYIAFIFVTILSVFLFFSLQSHLHMKTFNLLKNSILLAIGRPFTSLSIIITNIAIVYLFFSFYKGFLAVFFLSSAIAFMTFFHFNRMFTKIQDKQQELKEAEQTEQLDGAHDEANDAIKE